MSRGFNTLLSKGISGTNDAINECMKRKFLRLKYNGVNNEQTLSENL